MNKYYHNKLTRDKIPEVIEANDGKYELREMKDDEFKKELRKKLIEEAKETMEASGKEPTAKELADVLELIESIAESEEISFDSIREKQKEKKRKEGDLRKSCF